MTEARRLYYELRQREEHALTEFERRTFAQAADDMELRMQLNWSEQKSLYPKVLYARKLVEVNQL